MRIEIMVTANLARLRAGKAPCRLADLTQVDVHSGKQPARIVAWRLRARAAAQAATSAIPIVFTGGDDPIQDGGRAVQRTGVIGAIPISWSHEAQEEKNARK